MELDRLREFAVLANFANYTRAAQYLNMSQSALSKHIVSLEEELRIPLFIRTSSRVTLTPQGQMALNATNILLADYEKLKNIAREFRVATVGGAITNYLIVETLNNVARASETGASLQLSYFPALTRPAEDSLADGEIDLYVNYGNMNLSSAVKKHLLCRDSMVAFVRAGHFAGRESIRLDELKSYYFMNIVSQVFDSEFNLGWEELMKACRDHGFIPASKVAAINNECDAQVLAIDDDSCFVVAANAYAVMRLKQRSDLVAIPVNDATYDYYVYYRKDSKNPGVEAFIKRL